MPEQEQKQNNIILELSTQDTENQQVSNIDIRARTEEVKKEIMEEEVIKMIEELGSPVGRPSKLNKTKISKLKEAFSIDLTVEEACAYAGIHKSTFYRWISDFETLKDEFDRVKQTLPIVSKRNIADRIHGNETREGDVELAKWLLSRKQSKEYGDTLNISDKKEDDATNKILTREQRQELNDMYYAKLREMTKVEDDIKDKT